jgi:23S rRNA pseudouridine1911/1915/1917 synthase
VASSVGGAPQDASAASTLITVTAGEAAERIDRFLARQGLPLSRARIQRGIDEGLIEVNGRRTKASYLIRPGDRIVICHPPPQPVEIRAEPIPLSIVYEDEDLLVLDKPAGLVVHPAPGHAAGTLVNALLHHCRDLAGIGGQARPGIVHRLDKDTSGLLVAAKHDAAHVAGDVRPRKGTIDLAIGRDVWERKKISARTTSPRSAVSHYEVVERYGRATLVAVTLETGRTHQIRVHLAHLGFPVLGDPVYGGRRALPPPDVPVHRQLLHAQQLGFIHPITGRPMVFTAPLPEDMQAARRVLTASAGHPSRSSS